MVEVQRTKPRRFTRTWGHLNGLSAPVVAMLMERGVLDGYPLEATRMGLSVIHGAPHSNIWRRALLGDEDGIRAHLPDLEGTVRMAPTEREGWLSSSQDQGATSVTTQAE